MLRRSYSDHFLSIVCASVHPSNNIFKWLLLWSCWASFAQVIWSFLRLGKQKIAKIVMVCWLRWLPCPCMVKTFKNLLLQNRGCLEAESLHKSLGKGGLPKLLKWWSYIDIWPFYGEVKFASPFVCMGPYICMGKMLRISNNFSSEASGPMLLKFQVEPPLGRGTKDC